AQIGFIPANVLDAIKARNDNAETTVFVHDGRWSRIGLHARLNTFEKRSKALADVVGAWHEEGLFSSALDGWRDEMYGIYSSPSYPYRTWENKETVPNERAFELERAACALFGLATFGVHMTAYVDGSSASKSGNAGSTEGLRLWTPRRSPTKATWPSYLDNSVAGGITSGDSPYESMVRECWEEAGLPADLVRQHLRQTGVITYVYRTPEGYLQPEVEYTYDLPLPADVRLRPEDGEAEDFRLMEVDEVLQRMGKGEFKPNCALVVIDFLVRHGIVTVQEEPRYMEVVALLHNDLALPGP
ncbi:hypothetical protein BDZ90DRAFT_209408, partial [Jaminaea rosea]